MILEVTSHQTPTPCCGKANSVKAIHYCSMDKASVCGANTPAAQKRKEVVEHGYSALGDKLPF